MLNNIEDLRVYVRSILKSRISDYCDIEDVESEVFIALCRKDFKKQSEFKTYVYAIAKRRIMDFYRERYKRLAKEVEVHETFMAYEENQCFFTELNEALASLLPRHRMMMILCYLAEMEPIEICEIMGFGRTRLHKIKNLSLIRMKYFLRGKGYYVNRMV